MRDTSINSLTCNGSSRTFNRIPSTSCKYGEQCLFFLLSAHSRENKDENSCLISSIHIDCWPIISMSRIFFSDSFFLLFIFRTVSTTIRCWDCLPVRKKIVLSSSLSNATSSADDRAAAVLPMPVGAHAR